jgi:hypothetical protein
VFLSNAVFNLPIIYISASKILRDTYGAVGVKGNKVVVQCLEWTTHSHEWVDWHFYSCVYLERTFYNHSAF